VKRLTGGFDMADEYHNKKPFSEPNMEHMWQQFEKLKLRQSGQFELPFSFDEKGHTKEPMYEEAELSEFNKKLKKAINFNAIDKYVI
jgi:hypothetical protein